MKNILLFLSMFYLMGCALENNKPYYPIKRNILLQHTYSKEKIANILLFVPIQYDTLLVWCDLSDCTGCEVDKCRLTNSKSCLIRESGFLKKSYCVDNIDRLTIEFRDVVANRMKIDSIELKNAVEYIEEDNLAFYTKVNWKSKRIEKINNQDFIILDYRGIEHNSFRPIQHLIGRTLIKQNWVNFNFESNQLDSALFSTKAYNILKSVQIDTVMSNDYITR